MSSDELILDLQWFTKPKLSSDKNMPIELFWKLDNADFSPWANIQLPIPISITPKFHALGLSGYELIFKKNITLNIKFGALKDEGFVLYYSLIHNNTIQEIWDIYDSTGLFVLSSTSHPVLFILSNDKFDAANPIISHLYGFLFSQYSLAQSGDSSPHSIHFVEKILNSISSTSSVKICNTLKLELKKLIFLEKIPSLRWKEQRKIANKQKEKIWNIAKTKARVHNYSWLSYLLIVWLKIFFLGCHRFILRPCYHFKGLFKFLTLDVILWFFRTVKNNIGYSIALAIYGPFTFYFITQPLNPKAMWAVGQVRELYLNTVNSISNLNPILFSSKNKLPFSINTASAIATPIIKNTFINSDFQIVSQWKKLFNSAVPSNAGMLITTDIPELDNLSWPERMSNFKGFQIALEEHMVFATRMGRIEQIETQLIFPLTVRAAMQEVNDFIKELKVIAKQNPTQSALAKLVQTEGEKTARIKLYLWDKLCRFLRDFLYIVVDIDAEHSYRDRYFSEALVLFKELTQELQQEYPKFKLPNDYNLVISRLKYLQSNKTSYKKQSPLTELKKQSLLFSQKDPFNGEEFRKILSRQWEILFLQQNKAQDAANFGLMAYTNSIRNSIFGIQNIYATKRRELSNITNSFNPNHKLDVLYENTLHLMQTDLTSIAPELSARLPFDLEYEQRKIIIGDIEEFLKQRETFN